MYFNNVHILIYAAIAVIGFLIGKFVDWCNYILPEYKPVFSKEMFLKDNKNYKSNFFLPLITMLIYIILLYVFGIKTTFITNLKLIKYLILTPMLLSAFIIDYRLQIIPNRLNMTMFEIGIVFMFAAGIFNPNIAIDMFLGMITGAGIFLIITLIGGLVAGKEAMGFGDVKLMGALGIYFGLTGIIVTTIMSFLIGAIISIGLIVISLIKKDKEGLGYIAFGPFITIASFITMIVPFTTIINILLFILSLGLIRN